MAKRNPSVPESIPINRYRNRRLRRLPPVFRRIRGRMEITMEKRVAVMGIIVENPASVEALNALLHEFGDYIIGRMGIPYRERGISIVSIAIDAPQNAISTLSGKIGNLPGISVKTAYSNVTNHEA